MSEIDRVPRRGQGLRLDARFKLIKRKLGKKSLFKEIQIFYILNSKYITTWLN